MTDVMTTEEVLDTTQTSGEDVPKHNLHSIWCLWVNMFNMGKKDKKENWGNSNLMVHTLHTVEDFWCLFNNINGPSALANGDITLFKQGISPAWEDPSCQNGGRWVMKLDKVRPDGLDESWLSMVLSLIGEETFQDGDNDQVCGAVLSCRAKGTRKLALWMKTTNSGPITRVGTKFLEIMKPQLGYAEIAFENFNKQAYTAHLKT